MTENQKPIEQVLKEHTDAWMAMEGVVGTAIGEKDGRRVIQVFVVHRSEALVHQFPSQVDGYPVLVVETGAIHAVAGDVPH